MSHMLRMLAGCLLPFLLIFFLPLLGISEGATLLLAVILMFACHLMMMRGHHMGGHNSGRGEHHEHT